MEGNNAPLQYPPPFYYSAANIPPIPAPMYYPPAPFYPMWGYGHPHWPQQPYITTTGEMQHSTHSSAELENMSVSKIDEKKLCDKSREDAKDTCESPETAERDTSITISPDTPSDDKAGEPRLSLSSLKRDYSLSSSSATTPTSNSPTHHHDNSSTTSSPQQLLDSNNFEQQVMEFTSRKAKMMRSIKANPLSLPTDNKTSGNQTYL